MSYILDTNVVCALRVRGRNPRVEAWAASVPLGDLFVTATTVAEIERGVIAKERSDAGRGATLRRWFNDHVLPAFVDRVLSFDLPAARILAAYRVPEDAPFDDALIAAVAQSRDMTVATRNTKHFEPLGVPCVHPYDASLPMTPWVGRGHEAQARQAAPAHPQADRMRRAGRAARADDWVPTGQRDLRAP